MFATIRDGQIVLNAQRSQLWAGLRDGHLAFVSRCFGEDNAVWSLTIQVVNGTDHFIEIRGRYWDLWRGKKRDSAPGRKDGQPVFAPTFAGGHILLFPRQSIEFTFAIVTEWPSDCPDRISGALQFWDLSNEEGGVLDVKACKLTLVQSPPIKDGLDRLTSEGCQVLRDEIAKYNLLSKYRAGALLRADRIERLSSEDRSLIDRFLINQLRLFTEKEALVNFSAIFDPTWVQKNTRDKSDLTVQTSDHFIPKSEARTGKTGIASWLFSYVLVYNYFEMLIDEPADAGLEQTLTKAVAKYGLEKVAESLLRRASPEERARLLGMALPVEAKPAERPQLSDADRQEFFAFAKVNRWDSADTVTATAFIAKNFKPWLGRGLALVDVKEAQGNLASAYSTEVSRHPERRIAGLYVKPYRLPAGAPPPKSGRRVADLTEAEAKERRPKQAAKVANWRKARRSSP